MKTKMLLLLMCAAMSALAETPSKEYVVEMKPGVLDEFLSVKTPEGKVFKNVRVVKVTYDKLGVVHDDGAASLVLADMPGEVRVRFNYDKNKALHGDTVVSAGGGPPVYAAPAFSESVTAESTQYGVPLDVQNTIRAGAAKSWPNDYRMQTYYIDQQTKAFQKLQSMARIGLPNVPPDVLHGIAMRAHQSWGTDYNMVLWKIEDEVKAWKKLKGIR